jgi:tetratricopeptide (TPR) repeat protein
MEAEKNNHPEENANVGLNTLEAINQCIAEKPDDADLYYTRAELYFQNNDLGKAVNDYKKVLEINPKDQRALTKAEFVRTILRYQNTDIYANPNTDMDPWLE